MTADLDIDLEAWINREFELPCTKIHQTAPPVAEWMWYFRITCDHHHPGPYFYCQGHHERFVRQDGAECKFCGKHFPPTFVSRL